jgi:hypothetical protein
VAFAGTLRPVTAKPLKELHIAKVIPQIEKPAEKPAS